jgi:hypothetical protein
MSSFTSNLIVSPLNDGRTWTLIHSFTYDIGSLGSGNSITVPDGFRTDFASVPRIFWVIFPYWGKYGNAAVIHDFIYETTIRTRKEADYIFLEAMGVSGTSWLTRHILFWAVRAFGMFAYKRR